MIQPHRIESWYRRGALYQIYPLSFADSSSDGLGDLPGITRHLDYLAGSAESLGVAAIWLSPIYRSPMADWGYDVADYRAIDPRFGTMADFEELIDKAHGRNLRVLLDFVPNHTSTEHAWFVESRRDRTNSKRDWYLWADPAADGGPPNNWLSHFGGSAWTLDDVTGQYYLHSFLPQQADLNWRNPDVREAMLDVLRFWLGKGVDGFRTDALMALMKDPQLRDDPPNPGYEEGKSEPGERYTRLYSAMSEAVEPVLGSFCEVIAGHEDALLLSEAYLDIPGLQRLYHACADHPVHAPFNFNLMQLDWSAAGYRSFIDAYEASLGPDDWPNYVLGNHDKPRLASRVGAQRARLLAMLQLTLRGLPVIYNGEELGMTNADIAPGQARDPGGRDVQGFSRDSARSPIAWDDEPNFGFGTTAPWLPFAADAADHTVAGEDREPDSSLQLYRHLLALRQSSPALHEGDYRSLEVTNPDIFAFARETSSSRVFVVLNFSDQMQTVELGRIGTYLAGTKEVVGDGQPHNGGELVLEPYEGRLYEDRREYAS